MELECLEGRIFGARYYTVKPNFDWWTGDNVGHRITWQEMLEWCIDTYGASPGMGVWEPDGRWYANNAKFWFRNEIDRTAFVLRWS